MENLIYFLNVDFDSSKEASLGTEHNAKNHRSLPSAVTEKVTKKSPKMQIPLKNANFLDILMVCLDFLSKGTWQRLVVFCFFRAIKIKIGRKKNHHKGDPLGLWRVKII